MPTSYCYELRSGKVCIGYYSTLSPLVGKFLVVPMLSELKAPYGKVEMIRVPISYHIVKDDGVECTIKRVLDVRRKSQRQRNRLIQLGTLA